VALLLPHAEAAAAEIWYTHIGENQILDQKAAVRSVPSPAESFWMQFANVENAAFKAYPRAERSLGALQFAVGNTPLIRLQSITSHLPPSVHIYAKAEFMNPGGSVKDRAALSMIEAGERSGDLIPGKTIIDATSGNTGIAYAMFGASRGYQVELVLPSNASAARRSTLRAFGAKIIDSDPLEGADGARSVAQEIAASKPHTYFYPDQYNNPANWRAHYLTTATEIWNQTDREVTHFVAGLGTTGTFVGTARRLKELNRSVVAVSVQPDSPLHGLEGMKHLATAVVPGIYDPSIADENVFVSTEDAQSMTRRLAREEGLFVGVSSGANVHAAIELAERVEREAVIVTILCDGGSKYIDDSFWK
jgi:cysteine synthase B